MRTGRGFERLITFADAVVAIALTLLVLPLVEITAQVRKGASVGRVLADHGDEVSAFVVSFVVIWALRVGTLPLLALLFTDAIDRAVLRLRERTRRHG